MAVYEPIKNKNGSYQSEAQLEEDFIKRLQRQGYEYLPIHTEDELIGNLRKQISKLNNYEFSNNEWERFLRTNLLNRNEHIKEKTKKIQKDNIQVLECDNGEHLNIKIFDANNIHNNTLQVINQYEVSKDNGAKHNNRYDVSILVNGLPLVHVELKRRGMALQEAFNQINRYQSESFSAGMGLFEYIQIFVISNGTNTKYYSNTTRLNAVEANNRGNRNKACKSFEFTSFWADGENTPITDLEDFAQTFFARRTILNMLARYCVFTEREDLLVMRPYQIRATEKILERIDYAHFNKLQGTIKAGGYVWHTTGSGKTLTSFKTAQLISKDFDFVDKVLFVVDRKDLDYQTQKEYNNFEEGSANASKDTKTLKKNLEDNNKKIVITTIQKLSTFIKGNPKHPIFNKEVVLVFDECHRSQFGEMHNAIIKNFKKYYIFGFTGTPIFAKNSQTPTSTTGNLRTKESPSLQLTTDQIFGSRLHIYTIVNAINDKNVLPFHIDYIETMKIKKDTKDEDVDDIDREGLWQDPQRISNNVSYILDKFGKKTHRAKTYELGTKNGKKTVSGFNSILATDSVDSAKLYYSEFKKQMRENPEKAIKIALIYSYVSNEETYNGLMEDEVLEDTYALDVPSREFLSNAINDYNEVFNQNYSTDGDNFQNYYVDVSKRMKEREIDLLIVVNMFLTGFDAPTLNTLWVDKNLRQHGLIQAISRTNRILNETKDAGQIVCFRPLQRAVDEAISIFGDKEACGIVLLKSFDEYYHTGYMLNGKHQKSYVELINELTTNFPLENKIVGEKNQKKFINLFGSVLKLRNILVSFDEFEGQEILTEREFQDYLSVYNDLRVEWNKKRKNNELTDVSDDVVFETELAKQVEINIDYIIELVDKYRKEHINNKDIMIKLISTIGNTPILKSKKELLEAFIGALTDDNSSQKVYQEVLAKKMSEDLNAIIREENLNPDETKELMLNAFKEGELKTEGTDITELFAKKVSRFKGYDKKKEQVIEKLEAYFNKYIECC